MKKIYLSIPYSKIDKEWSFQVANKITGELMKQGYLVYSPISHSHPVAMEVDLPTDFAFWQPHNETFIEWCDEVRVVVLGLNGMDYINESTGVQGEIIMANNLNKPITYIGWTE